MVTFPPLYCFAANVAGDDATVIPLLDATGVHDYHPTPHDAIRLHGATLFFANGLDLDESFAKTLANNANNPKLKLFEVAEAIPQESLRKISSHDHDDGKGHGHGHHHHGEYDPHVWLGIPEAILMVEFIRDRLKEADPEHLDGYNERAEKYIAELKKLQEYGKEKFKDKKDRKLITLHDSLGYFARTFDLKVVQSIQNVAGEEDTSPKWVAELAALCEKEKIRVIAVEPNQMTNTSADTLESALKGKLQKVEVDMIESVPRKDLTKDYYTEKMKQNIDKLAKALK
jgi:ABC-type Zn uptake system ZnuABC Zn-binding protein ZnuA